MDYFATQEQVGRLEQALASAPANERAARLVELSWHLRQRDSVRAEALAREAEAGECDERARARAIATLAECAILLMRVEDAQRLAEQAAEAYRRLDDMRGIGDVAMIAARVAEARGNRPAEIACYEEALDAYRASRDGERLGHARAAALIATSMGDPVGMAAELAAIRADAKPMTPALAAHLRYVEGIVSFQRGEFLPAATALDAASRETTEHGLMDFAFRAEAGLVAAHSNLGDREASCILAERALGRARELGWPRAIGHSLANFARQLHSAGEHERAVELLLEAREVLESHPRARVFAIASYYLGDAQLALGRHAEALENLELAEGLMRDLGAHPEVACLKAISAQALCRLGRAADAVARAQSALDLARSIRSKLWEVEALRALAEVHATHAGAIAGGDPAFARELLLKALSVVDEIGGHHEKSEIYTELAHAHEAAGDAPGALAAERAARAEDLREQNRRASNRLLLARERQETERQRVEAELQRSLAAAQAERAGVAEEALRTLDELRQVGQDIAAELEPAAMLKVLERHLARLADVSLVAVFVFDARGGNLTRHAIERGRALPEKTIALENLESYAARAARTRTELYIEAEEGTRASTRIAGTEATRSIWFGPMTRGEELHGVLSVQSPRLGAYGPREKLIFRTVAGYAAVALANARIHGELEQKHRRLIETEAEMRQLATTDSLTGLANRRQFMASAQAEVARAVRYGGAMGLVMADLDRFKAVNDEGGHAAGDRVIEAVGHALAAVQRPNDVIARLGGEEFALVLPGANLAATFAAAERVRETIETLRVPYGDRQYQVTMSLGCSAFDDARGLPQDPSRVVEALMRAADSALYEAKRRGRNCTVASSPSPAEAAAN